MENGVVNLVNHLPSDRFRHSILCIEDYSEFRSRIVDPSVEVTALHRSRIGVWSLRRRLFEHFGRLEPDLVHTRNLSGLDAIFPAKLRGCKVVHSEHGFDVADLHGRNRKHALLRRMHAPFVDRFAAVSSNLASVMSDGWGVPASRIDQIYNGVDCLKFRPAAAHDVVDLPPGFADPDLLVIGTVGRLQPIKDQGTLIRAVAAARRRGGQGARAIRLVIVGDGPSAQALRDLAVAESAQDIVHFAGARSDVPAQMRAFRLFVLPSLNEGISNTVLEAMASGVPVAATPVGGNPELIRNEETGVFFGVGAVEELAALLQRYAADREGLAVMGRRAREDVVERFSLDAMLAKYASLYERVAGARQN